MLAQYLPKLVFKKNSMPLYVTYFVTNRCNLKCEHCFYSAELNKPIEELSLQEIQKMSKTMGDFPIMLYSGGEPFLRKDLAEITYIFYKQNKIRYLAIPTNGSFPKATKDMIEKICKLCPKLTITLAFSIDGLEEEHNKIRRVSNSFQNAIQTFRQIKELKPKYKNLKLGFITTFTASNQNRIDKLYNFLKMQKPDNISVNLIRGTPKDPLVKDIDITKFKQISNRVQQDLLNGSLPGFDPFLASMANYRYNLVSKTYEENKFQTPCFASEIACVIYPNGDIFPCESLNESKKIGNIRDYNLNFRKLWKSKRNQAIASWIKKNKCFCTHECNVACNTAFNLKHFIKIGFGAIRLQFKKLL